MNIETSEQSVINKAVEILHGGGLVALPTETVYGLAADATNSMAIAKVFDLKGRPQFNPLISHVSSIEMAQSCGEFNEISKCLALAFWPGPLTIVVRQKADSGISELACAGLETIALRSPNHAIAQKVIATFGKPLAAPSANISGRVSPTMAKHVFSEFGDKIDFIIDGGKCDIGLESTVVSVLEDAITILRHGAICAEEIEKVSGTKVQIANLYDENSPKSPGMLLRHYSPNAPLFMNCLEYENDEVFIGFGKFNGDFNLSETADLREAAASLYSMLRLADAKKPKAIKVAPIPNLGIGIAINDRLGRSIAKTA